MAAPREVRTLIQRFQGNRTAYVSGPYNETQLRREFLDPFFTALGWDVANVSGAAEAYKDVVHEDAIKIGGATKAPDYCFRIGGTRKFFVEAKRPSVRIKDDASPAYQLRRYAWSAKLPLSILTTFAEFSVYDCRVKPDKKDPASSARILYLTWEEYEPRWDELAGIFSKEAVYKGSFDRYAESTKKKRGTAEVDTAFLKEIEGWRDELARNIALRNPELSQRELNFAVQRTIDRLIFLRICEDRGIEEYGRLLALLNSQRVYPRLCQLFQQADERYNSGLFHFRPEKGRAEPPDELTLGLTIDDKVLKEIIRNLYYPDSPYEFSVLPVDILGQVYEQFLGKVIRLTPGHRAVVEDKPEVRKAGGIYYTPTYIVDYIVKNTVGELLKGKTPQEVGGLTQNWRPSKKLHPLRVLDPACGSGSFLLGAYQYLLDWYRDRYVEDGPQKHARGRNPRLYRVASPSPQAREASSVVPSSLQGRGSSIAPSSLVGEGLPVPPRPFVGQGLQIPPLPSVGEGQGEGALSLSSPSGRGQGEGEWRLTTAERKRILLTHIYGVDIDPQAVEVTKLSLLLKVLEGETEETLDSFYRLFQERALPDLGRNIKCGNSLIGPDFYEGKQLSLIDEEERYRINAFDWHAEFPEIMKAGGFDAVIGNPPWGALLTEPQLEYLKRANRDIIVRMIDSFMYFVHQGSAKLNTQGLFGMILPDVVLYQTDNEKLRKFILAHFGVRRVLNMGNVFHKVTRPACILILERGKAPDQLTTAANLSEVRKEDKPREIENKARYGSLPQSSIQEIPGSLFVTSNLAQYAIWAKVRSVPHQQLSDLVDEDGIQRGVSPDLKDAFLVDSQTANSLHLETHKLRKVLTGGKHVKRYFISRPDLLLIYTNREDNFQELQNIRAYIDGFKNRITCKEVEQQKHPLYSLHRAREERIFLKRPKLLGVITEDEIVLALDEERTFATDGLYLFGVRNTNDIKYVMGILNSRLFVVVYRLLTLESGRVLAQVKPRILAQLPIRTINFSDPTDKTRHDCMVELVDTMLKLHKDLQAAKTDHEKSLIQRQIDATDKQIDELVYELYGLSEEEIHIVEECVR